MPIKAEEVKRRRRSPALQEADKREADLRAALVSTQKVLGQVKDKREALVAAAYLGAKEATLAMGRIRPVKPPMLRRQSGKPEVALWHITDLQGGKKTSSYNLDVMTQRVHQMVDKGISLAAIQRGDHPVNDLCIVFGGDMIEGLFNFPTQAFEVDSTIFQQWKTVSRLLIDVTRRALGSFQNVTVVPEWGNHGRIGSKRDAVPRHDNIDRMCYEMASEILAETDYGGRLIWQPCPNDIQRIEIGNYRALSIHGDEIGRNGFSSPPAIARWASDMRSGAYPWEFRDVYIGHYHSQIEIGMANGIGTLFFTGSTESGSRYAMDMLAKGSIPTQRIHFVDPERGRVTARYTVWLD